MTRTSAPAAVVGPITGGEHGWPFAASMLDIEALGYREDEYFVEGTAWFGPRYVEQRDRRV